MKTKKLNNKLTLNKKTISHLDGTEMGGLKGGIIRETLWVSICICATDELTNCIPSCPSVVRTCYC